MPYKSKAERERELYADMLEAIAEFAAVDHCSEVDALAQLRGALADRMLNCRWGDKHHWLDWDGRPMSGPPDRGEWWYTATIRFPGDGQVRDDNTPTLKFRTLLIQRDSLSHLLSLITAPSASPAAGPAESEATAAPLRVDLEAAYKRRFDKLGYQTEIQDKPWQEQIKISRQRLRELREPYVATKFPKRRCSKGGQTAPKLTPNLRRGKS